MTGTSSSRPALRPCVGDTLDAEVIAGRARAGKGGRVPADDEQPGPDPRPAIEDVVALYGAKIYSTALHLTGNVDDAADLAQDVFERVHRNLHRYQPGTFDGWLYRITRNLVLDRVRRSATVRMEPLPAEEWKVPPSTDPGPADVIERATLEARLERALASLSPDFRLAVVLCDIEGLTYDEIVDATGWPLGTVRSRIHRGRKTIRDYLANHPDTDIDAPRAQHPQNRRH